jgi:long-chain acyl-CoA synthetase
VGNVAQPFREGWLATGDLGRVTEGALVIEGRKKELLKTSYGKYVRAGAIESRLRDLPGVAEAIVIAEGRPFCAALIWVEPGRDDTARRAALDAAILRLDRDLPHPEQVKRWTILTETPSVTTGELTPNLKLRRGVVLQRFAREIDALYERGTGGSGREVREAPREGVPA